MRIPALYYLWSLRRFELGTSYPSIVKIVQMASTIPPSYDRIREMGYEGRYTHVKEAVRELIRLRQEVFMPLIHRGEKNR